MNRHLMSVVISFSELAWIFLMVGGLLYARGTVPPPKPTGQSNEELRAAIKGLDSELQKTKGELDRALAGNKELRAQLARRPASEELSKAQAENRKLHDQLARSRGEQAVVNRDLIGLKGNTQRIVFVIDRSASMDREGRWASAIGIVKTWIRCLDVKNAAIVVFNRGVSTYPPPTADGAFGYLDIERAGTDGMIRYLSSLKPEGGKNMAKAMETAFQFATPDAIILFTDGDITNIHGLTDLFQPNLKAQILRLCQKYPLVPVNIVGLCNYMSRDAGGFMRDLALDTGGAFTGR